MKKQLSNTSLYNIAYLFLKIVGISILLLFTVFKTIKGYCYGGFPWGAPVEIHLPSREEVAEEMRREVIEKQKDENMERAEKVKNGQELA